MEDGLRVPLDAAKLKPTINVLILVLMEDGLRVAEKKLNVSGKIGVLILVLMEDGLRGRNVFREEE